MTRIRSLDWRAFPEVSWIEIEIEEGPTMVRQRRCTRVDGAAVVYDPTDLLSALEGTRRDAVLAAEARVHDGTYDASIVTADLVEWATKYEHAIFSTMTIPSRKSRR